MRAGASNFQAEELAAWINFAHHHQVKVYAAVNIFPHNRHLGQVPSLLHYLEKAGVDAFIISDPGILEIAKENASSVPIHLSTQANVTNWRNVKFWHQQGCARINLARELHLEEIQEIKDQVPGIELETFVHGAMCMAYSGRCMLSAYFTERGANLGDCTQPCRWKYYLVEEYRPHEPLPIEEHDKGSKILSSRDLCMIENLSDLMGAGIKGFKIEGRMKTIHYVATVTKAYKEALKRCQDNPQSYHCDPQWIEELQKVSHRPYSTGFFYGNPLQADPGEEFSYYKQCKLAGLVLDYQPNNKMALVEQRNLLEVGDSLEVLSPYRDSFTIKVEQLFDEDGNKINRAPHPQQKVLIPVNSTFRPYELLRKYEQ